MDNQETLNKCGDCIKTLLKINITYLNFMDQGGFNVTLDDIKNFCSITESTVNFVKQNIREIDSEYCMDIDYEKDLVKILSKLSLSDEKEGNLSS